MNSKAEPVNVKTEKTGIAYLASFLGINNSKKYLSSPTFLWKKDRGQSPLLRTKTTNPSIAKAIKAK